MDAEIHEVERQTGTQIPGDMRLFYLRGDGFVGWDTTTARYSMWPLARIISETVDPYHPVRLEFRDWAILCTTFLMQQNDAAVYTFCGCGSEQIPVLFADSFKHIVSLPLEDAAILYR